MVTLLSAFLMRVAIRNMVCCLPLCWRFFSHQSMAFCRRSLSMPKLAFIYRGGQILCEGDGAADNRQCAIARWRARIADAFMGNKLARILASMQPYCIALNMRQLFASLSLSSSIHNMAAMRLNISAKNSGEFYDVISGIDKRPATALL